ncbi:MAG: family 16 glycoside hydrolase, partial [Fuerstiella sp.]
LGDRLIIDENDKPVITPIENGLTEADIRKRKWNDVRVIAKQNHFQFYINGKLASEFTEYLAPERRLHKGMIQLQLHDPDMIVHFKDLRLKILK